MTESGWDIPGLPRDVPPADGAAAQPSASSAGPAGSGCAAGPAAGRGRGSCGRRALSSASAVSGSSDGAFARSADGTPPPAAASPYLSGAGAAGLSSAGPAAPVAAASAAAGPRDAAEALRSLSGALEFLARDDPAVWPDGLQADCLRALAVAESLQTAAHARVLAAFSVPGGGLAGDGHRSPRVWLSWQTQATRRAAGVQVGWMHRLREHPVIAAALASGGVSPSWARQVGDWTDRLPADVRDQADQELLDAAADGAALSDLFFIAEDLRREHARPDADDGDGGFADRKLRLATTFGGAGRLEGDLSARCAAAVQAVLDSLGKRAGPEDTRTAGQRHHDALEEAMLRLIGAEGMLPQRAGQPVRLEVEITLPELLDGTCGAAGPGAGCDAVIQPVITGLADYALLAQASDPGSGWLDRLQQPAGSAAAAPGGDVLAEAVALLSGPSGRVAWLRRHATGVPVSTVSLPLDVPAAVDTIPLHLRRAVRKRDKHCRFPGCDVPAAGCEVHHIQARKDGGRHALVNLTLLCRFHHLIAIHRWGWVFTLNADGTTTAVSPDRSKTLHSHAPPAAA
jgi:Domain of unknown function (DUF222)/HNH endonuclease